MILNDLFSMQDIAYREFNSKLIPTVDPERVIGVRTPDLRTYAKRIKNTPEAKTFMDTLPHRYFEEDNLHAFLIEQIKGYDACIEEVNRLLPFMDNWAACDGMRPKCFAKNKEKLISEIERWLVSDHIYTVRYGIEMLMVHFLDEDFELCYPEKVAGVAARWEMRTGYGVNSYDSRSYAGTRDCMDSDNKALGVKKQDAIFYQENYYVNMMAAWYFATALAKQYERVLPYLEERRLPVWVHNKTIQKAIESYRITPEQKRYLRELRVTEGKR